MARIIVLFLMVAALSFGLCDGVNIFGYEYKDEISLGQLKRHLAEEQCNLDAKTVAWLLAITERKNFIFHGSEGNSIEELLFVAERPDHNRVAVCDAYYFDKFENICQSLSGPTGNVHLLNYCNHCYKIQFEFCAKERPAILRYVVENFHPLSESAETSRQIAKNIASDGEGKAPADLVIENCARLLKTVKEALLFFDKDDEETSKFLTEVESTELDSPFKADAIYRRCLIINKLSTK